MSDITKPDMRTVLTDGVSVHAAMRQAVREAIRQHRMANLPMVVWRAGAIVWIPAAQLPDIEEPSEEIPVDPGV